MNWTRLQTAAAEAAKTPILDRFQDTSRAQDFSITAGDLLFDYSKTSMDAAGRQILVDMYEEAGVPARRDAMFAGAKINETEGRAVLHTALRNLDGTPVMVDGEDVMPGVLKTLIRMQQFAQGVRSGEIAAPGGAPFSDVVNIGTSGRSVGG